MSEALQSRLAGDGLAQATPVHWALRHCAGAEARGLSAHDLLTSCQVVAPARSGATLTSNQFALICIKLILELGDELQGSSSRPMPVGSVAMGVRLMMGADTLEPGLRDMLRFFSMIAPGYNWRLSVEGEWASLQLAIETPGDVTVLPGEEILIAGIHMYMSWFAGRVVPLVSAVTRCSDHPALVAAEQGAFLKCPTQLGQWTAISFPKACLGWDRRAQDRDRPVSQSVKFAIENIWSADAITLGSLGSGGATYTTEVLRALGDDPSASFTDVAELCDLTPITLWRYLKAEGTSFLKLRRTWITRRAIDALRSSDVRTEDLAAELGFSDARSFRHALKMITGLRPSDIRSTAFDFGRWEADQQSVRSNILSLCTKLDA